MIVYRDAGHEIEVHPHLRACAHRLLSLCGTGIPDHEPAVELLLDLGELESGIIDALHPRRDGISPLAADLRRLALAAGRLFVRAWLRQPVRPGERCAIGTAYTRLMQAPLPERVYARIPEGYAYYALYPESYVAAAEQLAAEQPRGRAVCIGLRSIGTSLSAVVAATLANRGWHTRRDTVRPRGDPFDRRLQLTPTLERAWRIWSDATFLIIDEGPGLSGSSFCGTAESLLRLGIPEQRIVILPSSLPPGDALTSPAARYRWPRHRKYHVPFDQLWLEDANTSLFDAPVRDLSGGNWRRLLYRSSADWPAAQPYHERRKYLTEGPAPRLFKFVGLAGYGRSRLKRAVALGEAGFTPPARALRHGFLVTDFVPGTPHGRQRAGRPLLHTIARYLAYLARNCPSNRPLPLDQNLAMIQANAGELIGVGARALQRLQGYRTRLLDAQTTAVDGRMLPHEWIAGPGGWLKTDHVDHHDDHFFPACQDIAWDVAGACVEMELDDAACRWLAEAVGRYAPDPGLPARLPFYRVAYAAYRLGYATLAARSLTGTPDSKRFARLARAYRRAFVRTLHQVPPAR